MSFAAKEQKTAMATVAAAASLPAAPDIASRMLLTYFSIMYPADSLVKRCFMSLNLIPLEALKKNIAANIKTSVDVKVDPAQQESKFVRSLLWQQIDHMHVCRAGHRVMAALHLRIHARRTLAC
eukprot:scaffold68619_cov28-Prasinocladus_malaysianus.AAC.1